MQRNLIHTTLLTTLMSVVIIVNTPGSHVSGHNHSDTAADEPGGTTRIIRMVRVDTTDTMRFIPTRIIIQRGEAIRFEVINSGQVWYEMALDTLIDFVAYTEQVRRHPGMEHADADAVTVNPS